MSADKVYMKNKDGVHLMDAVQGNEFTLCGDSFDIHVDDPSLGKLKSVKPQPITCPSCTEIILLCRGVEVWTDE